MSQTRVEFGQFFALYFERRKGYASPEMDFVRRFASWKPSSFAVLRLIFGAATASEKCVGNVSIHFYAGNTEMIAGMNQ